ncbi:hypothetical protein V1478_002796 [Vespula squamosa]|uniref:Uncharacterized protein n=1 Tax=Vespula squamosa TaxID=30214 RepID=A0ABD2BQW9_VESSQ
MENTTEEKAMEKNCVLKQRNIEGKCTKDIHQPTTNECSRVELQIKKWRKKTTVSFCSYFV